MRARKLADTESLTSMATDYRKCFKPLTRRATIPELVAELIAAREQDGASNVLRHSFISHRIAKVKSADQVALEAGNSPSIIFKHYRELTTEDKADKWFGIVPKPGQRENTFHYDRLTRTVTLPKSTGS